MANEQKDEKPISSFKFDPSVVFQLGESLITDEFQAIEELIKNAYDADATLCEVELVLDENPPEPSAYPKAKGFLVVRDNGTGMNQEDIEKKWLTISFSEKREMKEDEKSTRRKRTPLGDKGLGRLGVQRLGDNVDLWSRKANDENGAASYTWNDFRDAEATIDKIPIQVGPLPPGAARHLHKTGTQITISDLKIAKNNVKNWGLAIQSKLSEIISPFEEINAFDVRIKVNRQTQPLIKVDEEARKAAQIKYTIDFTGEKLTIKGEVKHGYMRPRREGAELFDSIVEVDRAKAFTAWLRKDSAVARDHNIEHVAKGNWTIHFEKEFEFKDIPGLEKTRGDAFNPGKFSGEVYYYAIASAKDAFKAAFGGQAEFAKAFKELSGVKIYRDGFQIRMPRDWLGLSEQFTYGDSWYGLRPSNTLGYVQISARENAQLEEVTDREGFKDSPAYTGFAAIMARFVDFTAAIQEVLKRGWNEYYELNEHLTPDVPEKATVRQIVRAIEKNVHEARTRVGDQTPLQSMQKNAAYLAHQADVLEARQADIIHLASLGITAEALTHEMLNILDRIADDATFLEKQLKKTRTANDDVTQFIRGLRTNINVLRKQIAYLAPALKYVREQKETFELNDAVQQFAGFWRERLTGRDIEIEVHTTRKKNKVRMNKGRLLQVLDNILLNSEYWVSRHMEAKRISKGRIILTVDGDQIRIEDNGPGVHKSIENSLFEPFVSGKEKGRGLGLYIVQQLLESMNCSIVLLPRESDGKKGLFEIDLGGVALD